MLQIDIWRAAKLLVDQHGESAWLEAAQRADQAIESGDTQAEANWRAVLTAINALQHDKRQDESLN